MLFNFFAASQVFSAISEKGKKSLTDTLTNVFNFVWLEYANVLLQCHCDCRDHFACS